MKIQRIEILGHKYLNLLRTDLFYADVPGNKYWKMKCNLEYMKENSLDHIVTFGGAFSNHIAAVAAAGKKFGLKTTGIIRGEESSISNPTLSLAKENGMEFRFVDRQTYREWKQGEMNLDEYLGFSNYYLLPEGGSNVLAVKGCAEILKHVEKKYDVIACPVGTGATLAGIISSADADQMVLGFSSMKGGEYIEGEIRDMLSEFEINEGCKMKNDEWEVIHDYHFGGFAKANKELIEFYQNFLNETGIELDLIYTSKMMFGLRDMIEKGLIGQDQSILAIHTGGQQGNASMLKRFQIPDS